VPSTPHVCLANTLRTLCDDAFFAIASTTRLDEGMLRALTKRRAHAIQSAARGAPPEELSAWSTWLPRLCAAMAPIAPPRFLAMADVIDGGVSLEGGARGVRSLFTSKPSEKEVARVTSFGTFAARVLASVLGSTGTFHPEARAQRGCFLASLGLSDEETRTLVTEEPAPAEAVEVPEGLPPKLARAILRGAFFAAMLEGVDPREEQAVLVIGKKTGLPREEITEAHGEARKRIDELRTFGPPAVDALRYVLEAERVTSDELAVAAARMTLPMIYRNEAITAVNVGGKVMLAKKHAVDRKGREGALGLAWVAALRLDPSFVRRQELAARHDEVAADLGDEGAARDVRRILEAFFEEEIRAAMPLVPKPVS
jgi:hypothetical protein